jgi:hypothetical protein
MRFINKEKREGEHHNLRELFPSATEADKKMFVYRGEILSTRKSMTGVTVFLESR